MPPAVAAAGIVAAGTVGSAIVGSKSAKKAANAQAQASSDQIQAARENRDYQYQLNAPTINLGTSADNTIAGLLGIGGNAAKSEAALKTFRNATGYEDILDTALGAVNSNAYASGLGDSGATMKALLREGGKVANSSLQGYIGNLTDVANRGGQARSLVAGVGQNATNSTIQALQSGADAKGNAALVSGSNMSNLIQGLANAGAYALGSSYGGGGGANPFNPPPAYTTPPYAGGTAWGGL